MLTYILPILTLIIGIVGTSFYYTRIKQVHYDGYLNVSYQEGDRNPFIVRMDAPNLDAKTLMHRRMVIFRVMVPEELRKMEKSFVRK